MVRCPVSVRLLRFAMMVILPPSGTQFARYAVWRKHWLASTVGGAAGPSLSLRAFEARKGPLDLFVR